MLRSTVLAVLVGVLAGGGIAAASTLASDDSIHGCVASTTGQLRVVDDLASCRPRETAITWNTVGPEGPPGPPGPAGPAGAPGDSSPSLSVILMVGGASYYSCDEPGWDNYRCGYDSADVLVRRIDGSTLPESATVELRGILATEPGGISCVRLRNVTTNSVVDGTETCRRDDRDPNYRDENGDGAPNIKSAFTSPPLSLPTGPHDYLVETFSEGRECDPATFECNPGGLIERIELWITNSTNS